MDIVVVAAIAVVTGISVAAAIVVAEIWARD